MRWRRLALTGIVFCFLTRVVGASVVLNSTDLLLYSPSAQASDNPTDFPLTKFYNATGTSGFCSANIDWHLNGPQTVFSFNAGTAIAGSAFSAGFKANEFRFTANANEPYQFKGSYNISQLTASGDVSAELSFTDVTANDTVLFENTQVASATANGTTQLVIPGNGGYYHDLSGSPTGNLIAGHQYLLAFNLSSYSYAGNPYQSGGNVTLTIGAVPEPTSVALFAFAAIIIGMQRSRKLSA